MGLEVGGLGPIQVAAEAAELPELVVALGSPGDVQAGKVPADQGGLPLGLGPGALALEDLGAVDPADAGEQHGRRQGGQPAAGGLGPLGRPADVGQLREGGHEVAVDVAGPLRAQLAGQHRQHGLAQQGHPLGHAALPDQHPALEQARRRSGWGRGGGGRFPDPPGRLDHGAGSSPPGRPPAPGTTGSRGRPSRLVPTSRCARPSQPDPTTPSPRSSG